MLNAAIPSSLPNTGSQTSNSMAVIALSDDGYIEGCSNGCEKLFGYRPDDLLRRHVSMLLPKLEGIRLVEHAEINPRLRYLCHCGVPFQAKRKDGESFSSELFLNRLCSEGPCLQLIVRALNEKRHWS